MTCLQRWTSRRNRCLGFMLSLSLHNFHPHHPWSSMVYILLCAFSVLHTYRMLWDHAWCSCRSFLRVFFGLLNNLIRYFQVFLMDHPSLFCPGIAVLLPRITFFRVGFHYWFGELLRLCSSRAPDGLWYKFVHTKQQYGLEFFPYVFYASGHESDIPITLR